MWHFNGSSAFLTDKYRRWWRLHCCARNAVKGLEKCDSEVRLG